MAEYAALWGLSILGALLFLGGWRWPFGTADFWGDFDCSELVDPIDALKLLRPPPGCRSRARRSAQTRVR